MTEMPLNAFIDGDDDGPVPFGDVCEGCNELVVSSHRFSDGEPARLTQAEVR